MPESRDPTLLARLDALATKVHSASRAAGVVRLDDVWTGMEEGFLQLVRADGVTGFEDIAVIRDGQVLPVSGPHDDIVFGRETTG